MKEPKKLKCKLCEATDDLYEHTNPANWTYVLCGKCSKEEKEKE